MTPAQLRMVDAIRDFTGRQGPPTIRELCGLLGIKSTNGVVDTLKRMERDGVVSRAYGQRGVRLAGETPESVLFDAVRTRAIENTELRRRAVEALWRVGIDCDEETTEEE